MNCKVVQFFKIPKITIGGPAVLNAPPKIPPINPSQLFFGEMRSNNLCLPNNEPNKYAKESLLQANIITASTKFQLYSPK